MDSGRCNTDEGIARFDGLSGDQIFFINNANCKSCQIVLVFRHQSRMLCSLTADQCSASLFASLCHTFYDLCDFLRIVLAAGNIVEEEQRLTACTCHIVDAHGNCVDTDGIMFVHEKCQLYFGSASVGSGQEHRVFHIFDGI